MRWTRYRNAWFAGRLVLLALLFGARDLHALDKQGSAHGGSLEGPESGFDFSGNVFAGSALYNPSYAARPDNTGLVLLRYGAHADIDLIGRRLSIPLDVNFFTDRTQDGANVLVPSEGDIIGGITSTWRAGPGALEVGLRGEHDRPLDRGGLSQSYADARARYLWSAAALDEGVQRMTHGGDIAGWLTLGGFFFNPTFAARPDNSGRALLRYTAHAEMSFFDRHFGFGVDATSFTDRREHAVRPSELDLTFDLMGHLDPFDLHLAYERDMPVDRNGLVQEVIYFVLSASFGGDVRPTEAGAGDMRAERRRSRRWARGSR